jgi:thiamine biosynthesis lipoprotein
LAAAQQKVGWQYVALDAEAGTIEFQRPGMTINLGAIGKGYALDLLAQDLRVAGVDSFLVHGGNSSLLAGGAGWRVGLQHPTQSRRRIGGLTLNAAALATSGSGKQFFHYQGRRLGHVIDPRSGLPVDHMLSLSVIAAEATLADALATGLFVAGLDAVAAHAEQYPQIGLVAVLPSERAGEVQVRSWNIQLDAAAG